MAYSHGGPSVQGQSLDMNVVGCSNLTDKEWFSRQDPYVLIEYSGQKFHTQTDTDGGKYPSFNETFKITLINGLREVNASVWNSNTIKHHDYIGSTKILLNKVIETGYDDSQWSLTKSRTGKSSGGLKLILHYAGCAKPKPNKFEGTSYSQPPAPAPATPTYYTDLRFRTIPRIHPSSASPCASVHAHVRGTRYRSAGVRRTAPAGSAWLLSGCSIVGRASLRSRTSHVPSFRVPAIQVLKVPSFFLKCHSELIALAILVICPGEEEYCKTKSWHE